MRCRDAKAQLEQQGNGSQLATNVQEHLNECAQCRLIAQRYGYLHSTQPTHTSPSLPFQASISTAQIMRAVQQQRHITEQLEDIHRQQCSRIQRLRPVGAVGAALSLFLLSSLPLLFFAMLLIQTDLVARALSLSSGIIDMVIILGQYIQAGLLLLLHNNILLTGIAFAIVVMMGMWLRLMRPPHETS